MLLLALALQGIAVSAEVVVRDPVLTITGHYRSIDGRVTEHKFPVEIKLLATGKFTGTSESWLEERLSDGTSQLSYFNNAFGGSWMIKDKIIHVTVEEGSLLPPVTFNEMNGLKIVIAKKSSQAY